MTIDDHIRDEKLQYNINREAAKISTLSSNKFNKYEYLKGEEILPFNQKQIFWKINKNNWRSRRKTNWCFKRLKRQQKKTKTKTKKQIHAVDYKNKSLIPREREIFKNTYNERLNKIEELYKIDYDDLIFITQNKNRKINFSRKKGTAHYLTKIKKGEITIEQKVQKKILTIP